MSFAQSLKAAGWTELHEFLRYRKGTWNLTFDTSNWIEVGTEKSPRIFDVPLPEPHLEQWCVNLIEHLCAIDDRLQQKK